MASNRWDGLLSNSEWYVPAANLLAYRLDASNPQTPSPASDQTLWSIGESRNGRFSGRAVARIVDGSGGESQSFNTMDGVVTPDGQTRITFTSPLGSTITGIGQLRQSNGEPAMEMQMITGGGDAYTTHWAYMLRLNRTTTPPEPGPPDGQQQDLRSTSYRWLLGSRWVMAPGQLSAVRAPMATHGSFTISGYRNGYFWGAGAGSGNRSGFSVLGSVTPEGNFFFNAIGSDDFRLRISQVGRLQVNRFGAQARIRPYDTATASLHQPVDLRLQQDPLISGGRHGERGPGAPLLQRPGYEPPLQRDWSGPAAEAVDPFTGRADQAFRLTDLAMGTHRPGWGGIA